MSKMHSAQALETVARQFPRTDRRVAIEVVHIKKRAGVSSAAAKCGLRFDRVAMRLRAALCDGLRGVIPDGVVVVWAITAPIRSPARTAVELVGEIGKMLAVRTTGQRALEICSNQVRAQIIRYRAKRLPKTLGFVHNPGSQAAVLLDLTQCLLRVAKGKGERWLVIVDAEGLPYRDAYRFLCSQLGLVSEFGKVLLVADGRVESLPD